MLGNCARQAAMETMKTEDADEDQAAVAVAEREGGDGSAPSPDGTEGEIDKTGEEQHLLEGEQNQVAPAMPAVKKKRNLPGMPDPDAEVVALSPEILMATNRFLCEICNKGFQRDQNLQLHRRGHNLPWKLRQRSSKDQRRRVYVCPEEQCVHHNPARALGDLTGIKKHYCRKHGEKKLKCDKCSKKYAVHSDWKAHQKTCGTREYRCDCGTLFSRRDSFITHRAFCDALVDTGPSDAVPPGSVKPGDDVGHSLGQAVALQARGLNSVLGSLDQKPALGGVARGAMGGQSLEDRNGAQNGTSNWNPGLGLWLGQGPGQESGQNGTSTAEGLQQNERMGGGLGELLSGSGQFAGMDVSGNYMMQQQQKGLQGLRGGMGTSSSQILNMDFSNFPQVNRGAQLGQGGSGVYNQNPQESLYSNLFGGAGNNLQGLMASGEVGNAPLQQSPAMTAAMRASGMDMFGGLGGMGMSNPNIDSHGMGGHNFSTYGNQRLGNGFGSVGAGGGSGGLTAGQSNFQALHNLFAQGGGDINAQQNQNMTTASIMQQVANLSAMNGAGGLSGAGQGPSANVLRSALLSGDSQAQLAVLQSLGLTGGGGGVGSGQLQQLLRGYGGGGMASDGEAMMQAQMQMQAQRQAASLANLYGMGTGQKTGPVNTQSLQDMLAMASSQGLLPPGSNLSGLLNSGQLQGGGGTGGGAGAGAGRADYSGKPGGAGGAGGRVGEGGYHGFPDGAKDELKALAQGAVTRDFMGLYREALSPQEMAVVNQVGGGGNQNQQQQHLGQQQAEEAMPWDR